MKYRVYIIKRLLLLFPTLFGMSIFTFYFYIYYMNYNINNPPTFIGGGASKVTPQQRQAIRHLLGLDQPIYIQYVQYLYKFFIKFNWGSSLSFGFDPVLQILEDRFAATAELIVLALVTGLITGIPIGISSVLKNNESFNDRSRVPALLNISLPIFWVGMMLQVLLSGMNNIFPFLPSFPIYGEYNVKKFSTPHSILFGKLPATGFLIIDSIANLQFNLFINVLMHLFLPMIVLSLILIPFISKITKTAIIELRQKDILLAKNQPLNERILIYKQVFKNACLPILTLTGLIFAGLLTGDILIELVFNWPGIGLVAAASNTNVNFNSLNGFVLLVSPIFVFCLFIIDLFNAYRDPEIRTEQKV